MDSRHDVVPKARLEARRTRLRTKIEERASSLPAQVRLPKYDHVVETFPSDGADQSLHFATANPGQWACPGYP
jgi:hypothetical protein